MGWETVLIVPLKSFGVGARSGDGETFGRSFLAGLRFFVHLRGVVD